MDIKKKETIKFFIAILILLLIVCIVISIVIRYQVAGETNMPFELSKITVISTAEGEQNAENKEQTKWNLDINQNNDIYLNITKNENIQKTSIINSVTIDNIAINKKPSVGNIKIYMPNSGDGRRFIYDESFLVEETLTYTGGRENDEKSLTIGNQGGTISIRVSNCNVGSYISNEDAEIIHDGTLINRINIPNDNIKFSMSFDLNITIDNIKYKANISLDLPYKDITQEGITKIDLEADEQKWVFKRV